MTLISKLRKLNASMILYDKNNLHSDFFFMQYKIKKLTFNKFV